MCGLVCLAMIELLVGTFALAPPVYDARSFAVAEAAASEPFPADGAEFVDPDVQLSWSADANAVAYDVYFGTDEQAVTDGTGDTFQGRHDPTTFDPGPLGPLATYYWRIDEIGADGTIHTNPVWTFTTVDSIVIDDFESYTNEVGHRAFETWIDGASVDPPVPGQPPVNASGAAVGHDIWSPDSPHYQGAIMEIEDVHGGSQAMPVYYWNEGMPHYSEVFRFWRTPQDWTAGGMNTLSLWFWGEPANSADPLYVALKDDDGWSGVVRHPDPNALLLDAWQQWQIRLTTCAFGRVDPTAVTQLFIGTGYRQEPQPGGEGIVYIDDIRLMRCAPLTEPNEPNFVVIDDFESYTNEPGGHRMYETWFDGLSVELALEYFPVRPNSVVGHDIWDPESPHYQGTIAETADVHGGNQAMPLYYYNDTVPYYSETCRLWATPQDWTAREADTLSLWFRGAPANSAEPFYIVPYDAAGRLRVFKHPDPNALLATEWQSWHIPLLTLLRHRVDITAIRRLYIGTGDRQHLQPGGTGIVTIDDIRLMRCAPLTEPNEPNFVVIDDFESYTNEVGDRVFQTWIDGCHPPEPWGLGPWMCSNVLIGHDIWSPDTPYDTIMETENVHGGNQAMPVYYANDFSPHFSETYRRWDTPQDWTAHGADTLSLWFRGAPANSAEPFYIVPYDAAGWSRVEEHPDPNALLATEWQPWHIPLRTVLDDHVDITDILRLHIGIGDPWNPQPGGTGIVYIDDIILSRSPAPPDLNTN